MIHIDAAFLCPLLFMESANSYCCERPPFCRWCGSSQVDSQRFRRWLVPVKYLRNVVLNGRLVLQFYHVFFSKDVRLLRDPLYELSIQFSWQTLQRPLALLEVFWFIEEWRRRSCFFGLGCFSLQTFTWPIMNFAWFLVRMWRHVQGDLSFMAGMSCVEDTCSVVCLPKCKC